MKFFISKNRDKSDAYILALAAGGHAMTTRMEEAQAYFYDFERAEVMKLRRQAERKNLPMFILPHSCECELQWDGLYPAEKVRANFVISPGQAEIMRRYGYPYPVLVTGWPFGQVKRKEESRTVRDILFAPKHPNLTGRKLREIDQKANAEVFRRLLMYCLGKPDVRLSVRYAGSLEDNGLKSAENVNYEKANIQIRDALRSIRSHQIIVGVGTFAHLAVAEGKAVVMFDQDILPHQMTRDVKSWELYRTYRAFPLNLFEGDPQAIFERAMGEDARVADWKERFIGAEMNGQEWVKQVEALL